MSILKIKDSQGNWVGVPTVKGDTGNGISSAILNDDYTLTLTFTDGTTYKTPSIRGEKGEKGEPATDMEIHICSASEYNAETRVPTIANPNDKTFYLVPTEDGTSPDLFTEWVYVNGAWEMFGSAKIDLSGYAEKTDTVLKTTLSRGRKSNTTVGIGSVAFGNNVVASGENAHSEGNGSQATGNNSHAEGYSTKASSSASHAEGYNTKATGTMSHAEGMSTTSSGNYSHAEGSNTEATKKDSHAEGHGTQASGEQSHAEGYQTLAMGVASHAEGRATSAAGIYSHAEGVATTASGDNSHTSGAYTIAQRKSQMAIGEYNVVDSGGSATSDKGNYILIAGNGTTSSNRSNAMTLDWSGNEKIAGSLTLGMNTNDEINISASELKKLKEMNPVDDVQINDTSIVENGVANIPLASDRNTGVIKISSSDSGLNIFGGVLYVNPALSSEIKRGENLRKPIAPKSQHESTFYGLAKASGDTTQSQSSNPVGTYTDEAKASIKNMLGVQDNMRVDITKEEDSETQNTSWQSSKTFIEIHNALTKGINVIVNDNDFLLPYVGQLYQNNIYWLAFGVSTVFNNTNVLFGYLIGDNNGQTIVTQINQNTPIPQIDDSTISGNSVWSSGKIKDELDYKVNDVRINDNSIVADGVANIPIATTTQNGAMSAQDKGRLDTLYADYSSALTALGVI